MVARCLAVLAAALVSADPPEVARATVDAVGDRAEIYEFPLRGTSRARGVDGNGRLELAWSPFGVAVTEQGHLVYDLKVQLSGLRAPSMFGAGAYVAWIATPDLARLEKLGSLDVDGLLEARVSTMNKFIFLVTAEASADVSERSGPIVARGVSPSGLLQSFGQHELFNNMPHDQ
jgi:hypothetical protein